MDEKPSLNSKIIFDENELETFKEKKKEAFRIVSLIIMLLILLNIFILVLFAYYNSPISGIILSCVPFFLMYIPFYNYNLIKGIIFFENGINFPDEGKYNFIPYDRINKIYLNIKYKSIKPLEDSTIIIKNIFMIREIDGVRIYEGTRFYEGPKFIDRKQLSKILQSNVKIDITERNFESFHEAIKFIGTDNILNYKIKKFKKS